MARLVVDEPPKHDVEILLLDVQSSPNPLPHDQLIRTHQRTPASSPALAAELTDMVCADPEEVAVAVYDRGLVIAPDEHLRQLSEVRQLLALEHPPQRAQAALAEHQLPHRVLALPVDRVHEAHVQLEEKRSGEEHVLVREVVPIVYQRDPCAVAAEVHQEPELLDRLPCFAGETMACEREEQDDLLDDGFAVVDHLQPAQAGDEADGLAVCVLLQRGGTGVLSLRIGIAAVEIHHIRVIHALLRILRALDCRIVLQCSAALSIALGSELVQLPQRGITHTESAIALKRKDLLRVRSVETRTVQDERGVVRVDKVVELLGQAVHDEQLPRTKRERERKGQIGVIEDG